MARAVIFGAGSVGRGLLAQLLCDAGWQVTFLDVDAALVARLAADGAYPHLTLGESGSVRTMVGPVTAIDVTDTPAALAALLAADLAATSVGARVLPAVADTLARAVGLRIERGRPPLNVLLAENVHGCAGIMRSLLTERLPDVPGAVLDANVGLLETAVGRMIPAADPATSAAEPTLVRAEPYRLLPYDAAAALGGPLDIPGLVADRSVPFSFYGERKLYLHNLGHCFTGCLGRLAGYEQVWQAIGDVRIRYLVRAAMIESGAGLSATYEVAPAGLLEHIDDLLHRFGNRSLADTNERVTRDLPRKLAGGDRLLGGFRLAAEQGLPARHLSLAIAAAGALLLAEDWTEARLWAHLDANLAGLLDPERRRLLADQLALLADGFDFPAQLARLEAAFEPTHVI